MRKHVEKIEEETQKISSMEKRIKHAEVNSKELTEARNEIDLLRKKINHIEKEKNEALEVNLEITKEIATSLNKKDKVDKGEHANKGNKNKRVCIWFAKGITCKYRE